MLKLLDIPEIRHLEDFFIIRNIIADLSDDAPEIVNQATQAAFGIKNSDLVLEEPDDDQWKSWNGIEKMAFINKSNIIDAPYKTLQMNEEELAAYFLCKNIDARDEMGLPLRCLPTISRVVEAAKLGIAGHLPTQSHLENIKLESRLSEEANSFLQRKA